jgi:cytochrome c oxidase subunit 2
MRRALGVVAVAAALLAAGCGGEQTVSPEPETVEGTIPTETVEVGEAQAGGEVFSSAGCGGCHTFAAANSSGKTGPDLDDALQGKDAAFIHESIVNPNAEIAQGFGPNVMPQNYGETLTDKQIADLVAFLSEERQS